jgi:acyl-CoA synthetase (AMP-forming)/AMP-acid ligase II
MPRRLIETALKEWPSLDFVNAYGLTQTSSTISILGPDEHRQAIADDDPAVRAQLASAGRPVPGIEIEIRNEANRAVAPGVPPNTCTSQAGWMTPLSEAGRT